MGFRVGGLVVGALVVGELVVGGGVFYSAALQLVTPTQQ